MHKFHSIATLRGDGLRPALQALFERLAADPRFELFVRDDGMIQAGPDPVSMTAPSNVTPLTEARSEMKVVYLLSSETVLQPTGPS